MLLQPCFMPRANHGPRGAIGIAWLLIFRSSFLATALQVTKYLSDSDPEGGLDWSGQEKQPIRKEVYRQTLQNYGRSDAQYLANITVGGQILDGILDTGSFELMVFSTACETCGNSEAFYSKTASSTYLAGSMSEVHVYGSGPLHANEGFEQVRVGPLLAENLSFWEVDEARMDVLQYSSFEAIVGIGPPGAPQLEALEIAKEDRQLANVAKRIVPSKSPSLKRYAQKSAQTAEYVATKNDSLLEQLNVTRFSVCLGQERGSDGYFVWNEPKTQPEPAGVSSMSVDANFSWGVKMPSAKLAGGSLSEEVSLGCEGGCAALLDSGTSLLLMPKTAAEAIKKSIEDLQPNCSDLDDAASLLPHLEFQLGEHSLTLPPQAYLGKLIGVDLPRWRELLTGRVPLFCGLELLIMVDDVGTTTQFGPMWIMGMPFFREYYTTFDLGEAGHSEPQRSIQVAKNDGDCTSPWQQDEVALAVKDDTTSARHATTAREFLTVNASQLRLPRRGSIRSKQRL
eukprot:TRINITY_DN29308_c0_g1_i2.p1 TRINITY_DN29308_c0_g1~~TRINITY_DN29308_c0_g1_i2.p1  ORF type:complete len:511 (-),score=77.83 TRINITY_DN29308_c0_g1_i2:40-1572(-)